MNLNHATWSSISPLASPLGPNALGWGIVGASHAAAQRLLPVLRRARTPLQDNVPVGIFSHSEHRARAFAVDHAIPHVFLNLADMLAHPAIQCVYVGNHPRHHAPTVLAALAAGKHVFCEPPLALSVEEAQRVAHTALSRGLHLAVNFVRRGDPAIQMMRELLGDHTIGDILGGRISHTTLLPPARQTWRLQQPAGGVLIDRTSHSGDLLRYLFNDEIAAIYAAASPRLLGDQVEEDVLSHVTLRRTGVTFQIHDSFIVPHPPNSIEVYGSTGTLVARHCWDDVMPSELWLHRHGQTLSIPLDDTTPYATAIDRFTDAVRHQHGLLASGADGVQSLMLLAAAADSIQQQRRINLPAVSRLVTDYSLL